MMAATRSSFRPHAPTGRRASLVARLIGYKSEAVPVTLTAGGTVTHDFVLASNPLKLGEIVITGTGTSSSVEKLGNVRNHVDSTAITNSNESNIVESLAGKAPNVEVTESSGEPGRGIVHSHPRYAQPRAGKQPATVRRRRRADRQQQLSRPRTSIRTTDWDRVRSRERRRRTARRTSIRTTSRTSRF